MTIHEYRRVFRERWLSIVLVVLLGMGAAAGLHFLRPPKYTAFLQMYISTRSVSPTEDVFAGEGVADRRVKSYVKLATSDRVATDVIRQLRLSMTPGELESRITAASSLDSVVIDLFAVDTSPEQAAAIVNATAQSLSGLVDELEAPTTRGNISPVVLKIVQPAPVPIEPTGRALSQWLLLGLLVGLAGGVVLALIRNAMDNTIKSLTQLRAASGVPNLGMISFDSQVRRRPLIVHDEPQSARAEAFRQLRTNVQFVDIENQHKILTVASPMAGEGKTTMLVNLALALGAAGGRVLIVEADLRRPKAADMLGMDREVGLTSVIAGRAPVHQAIRSWSSGPVDLLASGPLPPNPSELLSNPRMGMLLNDLRSRYDVILVDTPPLMPVTDAAAIAPATDGVILLCQFHQTTRPQVEAAVEALHAVGAPIVGSVFTKVPGLGTHDSFSPYTGSKGSGTARVDAPAVAVAVAAPAARTRPSRAERAAAVKARRGAAVGLLDLPTERNLTPINVPHPNGRPAGLGTTGGGESLPGGVSPAASPRPAVGTGGNGGTAPANGSVPSPSKGGSPANGSVPSPSKGGSPANGSVPSPSKGGSPANGSVPSPSKGGSPANGSVPSPSKGGSPADGSAPSKGIPLGGASAKGGASAEGGAPLTGTGPAKNGTPTSGSATPKGSEAIKGGAPSNGDASGTGGQSATGGAKAEGAAPQKGGSPVGGPASTSATGSAGATGRDTERDADSDGTTTRNDSRPGQENDR